MFEHAHPEVQWRKATRSQGNGECVEVAWLPEGRVGVRHSEDPAGPILAFSQAEWRAFLAGVHGFEFELDVLDQPI